MNATPERTRYHVGMRNVKSGLVVFLCLLLYAVMHRDGYFLACTSAVICMQDSIEKSVTSGFNRLMGTAFGALLGVVLLYLNILIPQDITMVSAPLGVMMLILFCNIIRKPDSIVISCVVLLLIVLQQTTDNPLLYGVNRLIDTFLGMFMAVMVNLAIRPPRHIPSEDEIPESPLPLPEQESSAENIASEDGEPADAEPKSEEGTV